MGLAESVGNESIMLRYVVLGEAEKGSTGSLFSSQCEPLCLCLCPSKEGE